MTNGDDGEAKAVDPNLKRPRGVRIRKTDAPYNFGLKVECAGCGVNLIVPKLVLRASIEDFPMATIDVVVEDVEGEFLVHAAHMIVQGKDARHCVSCGLVHVMGVDCPAPMES